MILKMEAIWIAKPVRALSQSEVDLWSKTEFEALPVSQTLAWAAAAETLNGSGVLVFSPSRKITALFLVSGLAAECVNGPVLDWNSISTAADLNEQVSRVVYALLQAVPGLEQVRLRPRLMSGQYEFFKNSIAFPVGDLSKAQTMVLDLCSGFDEQWLALPSRIRHEVSRAKTAGVTVAQAQVREALPEFWKRVMKFYQERSLFIPDRTWIDSLLTNELSPLRSEIWIASHEASNSHAGILVVHSGKSSHYFYAYEEKGPNCPNISLNSCLQWEAIQGAIRAGSTTYDLNGILHRDHQMQGGDPDFKGIDQYKRKFKGREIEFHSPVIGFGAV
jgi:hypothetical protein